MKNHRFLWLRNRTTNNRKCEKARNIKEKRTIEMLIRSQSSSSRSAVQQEIIDCSDYIKMVQKPRKIKVFRGFLMPKIADTVCPNLNGFGVI